MAKVRFHSPKIGPVSISPDRLSREHIIQGKRSLNSHISSRGKHARKMVPLDFSIGYGYLPVCWAFFTCLTFVLCYSVAVSNGHIYPFVPAISDTGAQIPEANLFSEFFNFSNALVLVNVVIRYLQFKTITRGMDSSDLLLGRLNKLAVVFGIGTAFGGTIIANFPSTEVKQLEESVMFGARRIESV